MTWISSLAGRAETKILLGGSALYGILLTALPTFALTLAGAALLLCVALLAARLYCAWTSDIRPLPLTQPENQFVSIHIATYSEPPDVVCRTLDSLKNLEHDNYEVIVLDNNTPDPALYEPVREHCQRLGSKFRFYHFDNVKGAKAGALNISLDLADPRTEYILVLDADYQAQPGILQAGLSYFVDSEVGLVQFPQAYRNSDETCGLTWEYKLFFDVYMNLANKCNTVLSTGTVSFVGRRALEASGGWSGETLTEDAELGLRLHRHGYRGVYVPTVTAAGVMPTDLESLKAQRRRWVLGNAQSLGAVLREPNLGLARKAMMVMQLTAWASPLLFSVTTLLVGTLAYGLGYGSEAGGVIALSTLSIVAYLVGMLLFFVVALAKQGQSALTAFKAYLAHLGMLWEASVCWCELFVESDKSFVRTSKCIKAPELVATFLAALVALSSGAAGLKVAALGGSPLLAFGCCVLSLIVGGNAFLRWNLHQIRQRTVAEPCGG